MSLYLFFAWIAVAAAAFGWLFFRNVREHSLTRRGHLRGLMWYELVSTAITLLLALAFGSIVGFALILHAVVSLIIATTKPQSEQSSARECDYLYSKRRPF